METLLRTIERRTVHEAVAEALRKAIYLGELPGGTRLNQDEIAAKFGVSRIPVREALRQLEAEGLVQIIPHRGAVVSTLSPEELRELYEIRITLESLAVRRAIPNVTMDVVQELERLLAELERTEDPLTWLDLNREFHNALYAPSGLKRLCHLIDTLRRNTERYLRIYVGPLGRIPLAQREHRKILEAYRERDADTAVAALQEHLSNTLEGLLRFFQEVQEAR